MSFLAATAFGCGALCHLVRWVRVENLKLLPDGLSALLEHDAVRT